MNSESRTPEPTYLSPPQVARAVGVSVSTIKRWVDAGVLPAHRTAGGHRKLILADVLRVTRDEGLPPPDACELGPTGADPLPFCRMLIEAAERVNEDQIRAAVRGAYLARLPVATLIDEVVVPGLAFVGREWTHGRLNIPTEHRVLQAVAGALYELRGPLSRHAAKDRPVAVGGAPEHDHYILPTLAVQLTLLDAGWHAVNVGPHTPMAALVTACEELRPRLVWVSASQVRSEEEFVADFGRLARAARERGIAVAVGGRALTPELRARLPYTTFGDGMAHLAAFARTLCPPVRRPRRGRPPTERP